MWFRSDRVVNLLKNVTCDGVLMKRNWSSTKATAFETYENYFLCFDLNLTHFNSNKYSVYVCWFKQSSFAIQMLTKHHNTSCSLRFRQNKIKSSRKIANPSKLCLIAIKCFHATFSSHCFKHSTLRSRCCYCRLKIVY